MLSPERLCLSMIRSALAGGAVAVNYARADAFDRDQNGMHAVTVRDMRGRSKTTLRCKTVVNAAGPWADFVMQAASSAPAPKQIKRSKGIHFVTHNVTNGTAMAFRWKTNICLCCPGKGAHCSPPRIRASKPETVTPTAVLLRLAERQTALPRLDLTRNDIIYAYAGLRPLVADAGDALTKPVA